MELVLTICLLAAPSDCHDEHLSVSMEQTTPMQCMIGAQSVIAEWLASRPKWKVTKWRCGPAGFTGKEI